MFNNRRQYYSMSPGMNRRSRAKILGISALFVFISFTVFLSSTTKGLTPEELEYLDEVEFYKKTNQWHFAVIADMDHASKVEAEDNVYWKSYLKKATLNRDPASRRYTVNWETKEHELKTVLNEKGRAMELSDLVKYNGMLLTCDDRTGIVYEILEDGGKYEAVARYILTDGDGDTTKGFKCEWGTVKDDKLYIGSFGKEYTNNKGEIVNQNPMWIKVIESDGKITHTNWTDVYLLLRDATGTNHPGYLFHESAHWHPILKRWFFLPRRVSKESYEPTLDESRGGNLMLSLNEKFQDAQSFAVGELNNTTRGFSCFRFIPGRQDEILAIKSEEVGTRTASYIMIFNLQGEILLEETLFVSGIKYEGIEFLDFQ